MDSPDSFRTMRLYLGRFLFAALFKAVLLAVLFAARSLRDVRSQKLRNCNKHPRRGPTFARPCAAAPLSTSTGIFIHQRRSGLARLGRGGARCAPAWQHLSLLKLFFFFREFAAPRSIKKMASR